MSYHTPNAEERAAIYDRMRMSLCTADRAIVDAADQLTADALAFSRDLVPRLLRSRSITADCREYAGAMTHAIKGTDCDFPQRCIPYVVPLFTQMIRSAPKVMVPPAVVAWLARQGIELSDAPPELPADPSTGVVADVVPPTPEPAELVAIEPMTNLDPLPTPEEAYPDGLPDESGPPW